VAVVVRSALNFNSLLLGYSTAHDTKRLAATMRAMERCGVQPDVLSYNVLLAHFATESKLDSASVASLLQSMQDAGVAPDDRTAATVVRMHALAGDMHGAQQAFESFAGSNREATAERDAAVTEEVWAEGNADAGWGVGRAGCVGVVTYNEVLSCLLLPRAAHAEWHPMSHTHAEKDAEKDAKRDGKLVRTVLGLEDATGEEWRVDLTAGDEVLHDMSARGIALDGQSHAIVVLSRLLHVRHQGLGSTAAYDTTGFGTQAAIEAFHAAVDGEGGEDVGLGLPSLVFEGMIALHVDCGEIELAQDVLMIMQQLAIPRTPDLYSRIVPAMVCMHR
jgi:hypothetical protein